MRMKRTKDFNHSAQYKVSGARTDGPELAKGGSMKVTY